MEPTYIDPFAEGTVPLQGFPGPQFRSSSSYSPYVMVAKQLISIVYLTLSQLYRYFDVQQKNYLQLTEQRRLAKFCLERTGA
jgi:hypothetical protein